MKWPYENELGIRENVKYDVVVLGGGISGCLAAIAAKKKGLSVAIVEKGSIGKNTENPIYHDVNTYNSILNNLLMNNGEELLNQFEKMGLKDHDITFDIHEQLKTKILSKNFKSTLLRQLRILGIKIFDRVEVCNLLINEHKVCGAIGMHTRTAKTFIIEAKAIVLALSKSTRIFQFNPEIPALSESYAFQCVGSGIAMAIRNGIEIEFNNKYEYGIRVDHDLKSSVDGLYICGKQIIGCDDVLSCISGDYAGNKASDYAIDTIHLEYDSTQIDEEEKRMFSSFYHEGNMNWIQMNEAITKCMNNSMDLNKIENDMNQLSCKNPHDLVRIHEIMDIFEIAKMIVQKLEESYE